MPVDQITAQITAWLTIQEALESIQEPKDLLPIFCMIADWTAAANNMPTLELLDRMRPMIELVNNDMGELTI